MSPDRATEWRSFILANTRLLAPPLVPELRLHLAEESVPIWQKTEEELGEMNVPPPFWAFAWAGGQALARYILDNRPLVAGRRVLDLGAGCGLVAIAAMRVGARAALAVDIDTIASVATVLNGEINGVEVATSSDDVLDRPAEGIDVVCIGDLFYERTLADRVLAYAERARAAGASVLVGDPRRSFFPESRFERVAEYQVPVTRELEDSEIKRAAVWSLAEAERAAT